MTTSQSLLPHSPLLCCVSLESTPQAMKENVSRDFGPFGSSEMASSPTKMDQYGIYLMIPSYFGILLSHLLPFSLF